MCIVCTFYSALKTLSGARSCVFLGFSKPVSHTSQLNHDDNDGDDGDDGDGSGDDADDDDDDDGDG